MFRIMLLLCYSLINTNTIPFYFSLSQIGRAEPRTQHAQSSGTYPRVARTVPRSFVFLTAKLNHLLAPLAGPVYELANLLDAFYLF